MPKLRLIRKDPQALLMWTEDDGTIYDEEDIRTIYEDETTNYGLEPLHEEDAADIFKVVAYLDANGILSSPSLALDTVPNF